MAPKVKCLPAIRETWVQLLGQEDPLEKEMAIHSSSIAWRIPWRGEPGRLQTMGSQRAVHDEATSHSHSPVVKMLVQTLDGEEPLEKEMAIHSTILSWEIPWTEEPGGLLSSGSQRVRNN